MYPSRKQRIALFGGSFNPPHKAHIELSNYAIRTLRLDLLIFIPAYKSVDKENLSYISGQERKHMLEISRDKRKTVISDFELNLQKSVQSIETIGHFANCFKSAEVFFLLGDDHLSTLHTWENYRELFELSTLVVFRRSNKIPKVYFSQELFSELLFLNNKIYTHSSSTFRSNLDFNLLHKKVAKYIKKKEFFMRLE